MLESQLNPSREVEAALTIPVITMVQLPLAVATLLSETAVLELLRQRQIGLFVREILSKSDIERRGTSSIREALSEALAPEFVTASIVGVSARQHLHDLLSVLS